MLQPGACIMVGACLLPTEQTWGCSLLPAYSCDAVISPRSSTRLATLTWQQRHLNNTGAAPLQV